MTDEPMTLRECVMEILECELDATFRKMTSYQKINAICYALEDTGAPAHMRVAKELRGEVG